MASHGDIDNASVFLTAPQLVSAYLALPTKESLLSNMESRKTAAEAHAAIVDAEQTAWSLRCEAVRLWPEASFGEAWAIVVGQIGNLPDAERRVHPILGPILRVYYEELVPAHRSRLREEQRIWELNELPKMIEKAFTEEAVRMEKDAARKNARTKGGHAGITSRDNKLLIRCLEEYIQWALKEKKDLRNSMDEFKTQESIKPDRLSKFLKTLVIYLEDPEPLGCQRAHNELHSWYDTRMKRQKRDEVGVVPAKETRIFHFRHLTEETVSRCMDTLKTASR